LLPCTSDESPTWFTVDLRFVIATVMLFSAVVATVIRFDYEVFDPLADSLMIQGWVAVIARLSLLWFTMDMLLIVIRTLLWVRYRPFANVSVKQAPRLTIVIPAYNRGAMVRKVVDACAREEYPRDRLEIIVVNEGRTDDTEAHADQAHRDRPGLVQAVHLPVNAGKRAALAAGFARATREIMVAVDSDSLIERGALLAVAGPFRDPRVGVLRARCLCSIGSNQSCLACSMSGSFCRSIF